MATPAKDPVTGKFLPSKPAEGEGVAPAAVPEPSKENLDALQTLSRNFLGDKEAKPGDKKPGEEDKAKKEADEAAAKKVEEDKKAKAAAAAKRKPTATETLLERTTGVLEKVATNLNKAGATPPKEVKEPEADPLEGMDSEERRTYTVLQQMEKDYPDRYKGIANKYINGQKKLSEYVTKWEAEHPGQEFDEEAEEHNAFYSANDVDWNDTDFVESLTTMKSQAAIEEHNKKINSKLTELERAQAARDAEPKIAAEGVTAARSFWKQFGKEFEDLVSPTGAVDQAKLSELQKTKKTMTGIGIQAAERVEGLTGEMYKLLTGLTPFNDKNNIHGFLIDFALNQEKKFLALPADDRQDQQGRDFKTRKEFRALPEDQRKNYWTFSATDFGFMLATSEAARANALVKQKEQEFREMAAERGIKIDESTETPPNRPAARSEKGNDGNDADDDETRAPSNGKPISPSSTPEPKVAAAARGAGAPAKEQVVSFLEKQMAKS